jgi:hypothetical protein
VIDPGHGGSQKVGGSSPNNATGPNGLLEKDLTLDLARRLPSLLTGDADVVLTRNSDANISLADRARAARDRNADLFLSIHLNGFSNPQTDGTETWVARQANGQSRAFAQAMLRQILAVTGVNDRGVKQSDFGVILPNRHAPQTAACLLEVAFLTNPAQAQRLTGERYKQQLAEAIAAGVREQLRAQIARGQSWGEALDVRPSLSNAARMEWQDLTMVRGSDGQNHLYYFATGGPEGVPATFNLKVTNTNSHYNFENTVLKVRLSKKLSDGSFRTIPLRGQTGEYKVMRSQEIEDETSRVIPIQIERQTLIEAYKADPDSPFTRLEVEFHWTEGSISPSYHYNRHSLAFFLVQPFEFLFNTKRLARRVALNDPQHRKYWTGIWEKEFSAADRTPLTVVTTIQTSISESGTDEITMTRSTTETRSVQRGVENTYSSTSKASFGAEDVVKIGLEQQESVSVKTSISWSESIARQFSESLRSSRTFTQSFTKTLQVTSQISPAAAGKIKTLYVYPIFDLYKVRLVRFEGPNRLGQATRRTEFDDVPVLLFSHWGDKQVETDAAGRGAVQSRARGQSLDGWSLSADEWNPTVRQTLEEFLNRFANIAVNAAGSSVAVRPPYFINRDNERKRRALENRRNAPREDKEIFEQQRFAAARVGKPSINQLKEILQLAVDRGRIAASGGQPHPSADDCRQWLVRYGLGIDCSGFVTQALNQTLSSVFGRSLNQSETLDPLNVNAAALKGGARGFTTIARPDQLRTGDTMHKPGHIRIVTRVEITGEGHVKFMTAESSSVNDIGPTHNVWRYRNRAQFTALQKESNRDWNGSGWQNVNEQDTFGRYNILARFIEANSPARTQSLAHYGDDNFDLPFDYYGYAQQSSPRIGWPDAPPGGRNAAEASVQGMRRIPLAGLSLGNQQAAQANGVSESAAGRAIVLIPTEIESSRPVETLLHLHGYNIGYRQRSGAEPRDIAIDRIPEQLVASRRNIIAVLPQGTTTSGFGNLDANAYLNEIFTALDSLGVWKGGAPQRGRVILSGHSGAGGTIAGILGERNQPRLPRNLAALLLFDAINVRSGRPVNESGELRAATAWVKSRLDRDLDELRRASDAAARSGFLQNSARLRGYFTPGHYANLYRPLEAAINEWFRSHQSDLQSLGQNIGQSLRDNYRLTPVSSFIPQGQSPNHDRILALGNALQNALASLASSAAAPARGHSVITDAEALFLQSLSIEPAFNGVGALSWQ